ncbi:hypothetical protein [Enterocloster sp.]|nr:hypothetical protein [Enterocloster sp.]MBS5406696.1 hypothetical protein [Enterocloster sp.]
MDVGWNEARSDTHEEIREVEIEYSRRNYGNNGAASIPAIQGSAEDTG